jgi:hypothetical protein
MSNSAIIKKIEFKYQESDTWSEIEFTAESAKLDQGTKKENGNRVYIPRLQFKIAKNNPDAVEPIASLLRRKAIYRATDGNGVTYIIGTDEYKAPLEYSVVVAGNPGGFNGREVEINWRSPLQPLIV